jgi:antirestriction protein ArdC
VLLGDRLDIGSGIESHAAYLGHWIELLKASPRVLLQVLSEARQAADLICPEVPLGCWRTKERLKRAEGCRRMSEVITAYSR